MDKRADVWKFQTILKIEFKCSECDTKYNYEIDVTNNRHTTSNLVVDCSKCGYKNNIRQ